MQLLLKPEEADKNGIIQLEKPFVADQVSLRGLSGSIENFVFDFIGKPYYPGRNRIEEEKLPTLMLKGKSKIILIIIAFHIIFIFLYIYRR